MKTFPSKAGSFIAFLGAFVVATLTLGGHASAATAGLSTDMLNLSVGEKEVYTLFVLVGSLEPIILDSAVSALPALNPNQPIQSIDAPITANVMLCGAIAVSGNPFLLPRTSAATIAATPALICTTEPPAKSINPRSASQPPPQTQ